MVSVLGLDIGGANTKAAYINTHNGFIRQFKTSMEYFPVWKNPEKLSSVLVRLSKSVSGSVKLDCVGVTMTAELSDAYRTKREGVNHILDCVSKVLAGTNVLVLDVDGNLRSVVSAKREPLKVAAANWAATGWMVSHELPDCVVVDVGSTSTSIIPILEGKLAALGKTDLEKLIKMNKLNDKYKKLYTSLYTKQYEQFSKKPFKI